MEIVMLAAGTSSRMGKENKLLLPWKNSTIACHCCLQALSFLEDLNEKSHLIIVTGYKRRSLEKSLEPCKTFIEKTNSPISMTIVENKDYRKGQFSSAKTGIMQVTEGNDFFICLADMPLITKEHFMQVCSKLEIYDAVRPVYQGIPGHPVLISTRLQKRIINSKQNTSLKDILKTCNVRYFESDNSEFISDCDTPEDFCSLTK